MSQEGNNPASHQAQESTESAVRWTSPRMRQIAEAVLRVAPLPVDLLLIGEPGTGKRFLARQIHRLSPWSEGPFIELANVETGLVSLETVRDGSPARPFTLFIPELAELPEAVQRRLLGLLEERERGTGDGAPPSFRVIAATRQEPLHPARRSSLLMELFSRLSGVTLRLPPLRERLEDLEILWEILQQDSTSPVASSALSPADWARLRRHTWPGNLAELRDFIARIREGEPVAEVLSRLEGAGGPLRSTDGAKDSLPVITKRVATMITRELILKTLAACNGNRRRAAARLNISYRALVDKMRKLGIAEEGLQAQG